MIAEVLAQVVTDYGDLTFKGLVITAIVALYKEARKCWRDREQIFREIAHLKKLNDEDSDEKN